MRRVLGLLIALLAAAGVGTGCQLKAPSALVRQAPNPCTTLGQHRLARLAGARGAVTQVQVPIFSQAQSCEFKADAGTPVIVVAIFDGHALDFDHEVAQTQERYQATRVRPVTVPGTDRAATMRANLNGAQVPVMIATHNGFIYLVLTVTRIPARGPRLERAVMTTLVHATR